MIAGNPRWMLPALVWTLFVLWPLPAGATVYSWKGEGGVLTLSNDPRDVPEEQRASVRTFTARRAPRRLSQEATPDPPSAEGAPLDAYERGYQHGMEAAERQVALAEELARTILAAVPQTPPAPIVIAPPAPPSDQYSSYPGYGLPYYYGPYSPFLFGSTIAFGGRFAPHRHFFPGAGRRFGPFSPHGHGMRSRTPRMR